MKNAANCDKYCELQIFVNHRIFERTLRLEAFLEACLFERRIPSNPRLGVAPKYQPRCQTRLQHDISPSNQVGLPAELKHINKRRKRNQQGLPQ